HDEIGRKPLGGGSPRDRPGEGAAIGRPGTPKEPGTMAKRRHSPTTARRPRQGLLATCVTVGLLGPPLVGVLAAAPASAGVAMLTPIEVTTTEDVVDPADGLLSLREAVDQANADGLDNEIVLADEATYVLDECGGGLDENVNVGGDLDHTEDRFFRLLGGGSTIQQTCNGERVIHSWDPGAPFELRDVRITGGRTAGPGGGVMAGGSVSLRHAVVEGNVSGHVNGGGGVAANLVAEIFGSTIRNNVAAGRGGGVRSNEYVGMNRSSVVGNSSGDTGGGVSAGTWTNTRSSTISGNRAAVAGGG
ncbi:hypothetical protein B7486_63535, partial [cyanobacterium TDX16]